MSIALDTIILITLLSVTGWGARRGLILTAGKLISVSMSFIGAWAVAFTFKAPIAQIFFHSWISRMLANSGSGAYNPIQAALDEVTTMGSSAQQALIPVLRNAGLPSFSISVELGNLLQTFTGTGTTILDAAAMVISERIAFVLLFTISFFSLQLIISIISHNIDGLTSLPLMSSVNHIGGGLCGLVLGAFFLSLVIWLVRTFLPSAAEAGGILSKSTIADSRLVPCLYQIIKALQ